MARKHRRAGIPRTPQSVLDARVKTLNRRRASLITVTLHLDVDYRQMGKEKNKRVVHVTNNMGTCGRLYPDQLRPSSYSRMDNGITVAKVDANTASYLLR